MTREEFTDDISNLDELYDFCVDNDMYEVFDERYIQSEDSFSDWIEEYYLEDLVSNYDWETVRRELNDLRDMLDSYEWFDTSESPCGVPQSGYTFDEMKEEAYERAVERGVFDDDIEVVENDEGEEIVHSVRHQYGETQVRWGVVSEKPKEESIFIPQEDISMLF